MSMEEEKEYSIEQRPFPDFDARPMLDHKPTRKWPFPDMEVGDCLIARGGPKGTAMNSKAYNAVRNFMDRDSKLLGGQGRKFRTKKLDDKPGYIGIWRTE